MKKRDVENLLYLKKARARSAWDRGVYEYALELLADINERYHGELPETLNERDALNGARDWIEYSCDGCALIWYNDIARRLCTPSEYKKTDGGSRQPNSRETWMQAQARALYQAFRVLQRAYIDAEKRGVNNEKVQL